MHDVEQLIVANTDWPASWKHFKLQRPYPTVAIVKAELGPHLFKNILHIAIAVWGVDGRDLYTHGLPLWDDVLVWCHLRAVRAKEKPYSLPLLSLLSQMKSDLTTTISIYDSNSAMELLGLPRRLWGGCALHFPAGVIWILKCAQELSRTDYSRLT